MIRLSNGHEFTFCCASGALGFDGLGYWWEQPLRWLGILRPAEFTIIAKTVTFAPRTGNLKMCCPWRCVRLISGGAVNAVGLTNMGYEAWIRDCYPVAMRRGYSLIASIQPTTAEEGAAMGYAMGRLDLKAVEVNLSCPNTEDEYDPVEIARSVHLACRHPVIAKLGIDTLSLVRDLAPYVEAFDIINTVPWASRFPDRPSPLAKYGLTGGVSGRPIRDLARLALIDVLARTDRPIITGGGIDDIDEVLFREDIGASAFSLGTVFLRTPWRPNRIVAAYSRVKEQG